MNSLIQLNEYNHTEWPFETNCILVSCCATMSVSAFGPDLYDHRYSMGQFNFKTFGLFGRPVYQNSRGRYLFYSDVGHWLVSLTKRKYELHNIIFRIHKTNFI